MKKKELNAELKRLGLATKGKDADKRRRLISHLGAADHDHDAPPPGLGTLVRRRAWTANRPRKHLLANR
jgi:hypothetical protein